VNGINYIIEEEFDTEAKMQVFSYNAEGETDTLMSPMDSLRYLGGADHKYFKYDHANNDVQRQVGSTIKPFLYTLSIDLRGYSPCYQVMDAPITLEAGTFGGLTDDWTPKNAGEFTNQPITLQLALQKSKNSVSAFLMKDLGSVEPFRDFLGNVGINLDRVPPYPSVCLGTPNLSVFEMTGAYTAFANEGIVTKPVYITSIEDKNGNIIYESVVEQKQAADSVSKAKSVAKPVRPTPTPMLGLSVSRPTSSWARGSVATTVGYVSATSPSGKAHTSRARA